MCGVTSPAVKPPALDVPSLAVHALWWVWFPTFLTTWGALTWGGRLGMLGLGWAVLFWNYAVLHNHMHVPIARPRLLKAVVSRTLGLACGFPYRGYSLHHFNHHKYNDGPGDWGQRHPSESVPHYLVRSTLTPWVWPFATVANVWRAAKTRQWRLELVLDFAVVDGFLVGLFFWEPAQGLALLALWLVGQFSIYWLNLASHFDTDSRQRDALAITSTSWFYNFFFFNAGHHQAHHLRPQTPWRELSSATQKLAAEGRVRPALQTSQSPINPLWVMRVVRSYGASPCARQTESTITSGTPSADT
ncbi:fatty acid desaturase [Stigmatella sp. ncwal1]|uniref:Fatty acid desaturase n=1 Tax=Stigmatella ashevillensis TaxID=2995309 RepID=A0ABT5DFF1_9BACT|nr:fatty acid desaturase [Stigmatella ashevillena]MDC0711076.1 fatty acid desaturase [Stigmatella ashevillena]